MTRQPVDRLLAAYNLLLAALWVPAAPALLPWPTMAHLAAACLPSLLDRDWGRGDAVARALREAYPLFLLLGFWSELGSLLPLLHRFTNDDLIAGLDLAIFGTHLNATWATRMPQPWLSELMHFAYFIYLPLIFLPPVAMGVRSRVDAMRDMVFRLLVTYIGCYLVYLAFPVLGPREALPAALLPVYDGFFHGLTEAARNAGDSLGTAFPSSHAAGAVTVAYIGLRWCGRWVAGALTLQAAVVVLATVYTGNHYALDAAAGAVYALVLQGVVAPTLLRRLQPTSLAPVPLLPRFTTSFVMESNAGWRP